jgi:hypothetical protein
MERVSPVNRNCSACAPLLFVLECRAKIIEL